MSLRSESPKIALIGAGSTVFARNLMGDILSFPELRRVRFHLYDVDRARLDASERVVRRLAETLGADPTIETTTDRERALDGADYALSMIQVGGYKPCTVTDFEVSRRFGLRHTIADTLGVGGIMRAARTLPVMVEMCRDMERLCPDVVHLNYVNPMAMICGGLARTTKIKTIGLCHSVQHTAGELAKDIGVPLDEINYVVGGINHMAFYLRFERNGEDLYPLIRRVIEEGRVPDGNRVRYHMLERLGYFVTESSEHFAEYVPWFIKNGRPDLIERFNIPLDEYPRRCEEQIAGWEALRTKLEDPNAPLEFERSVEYGSRIIHSLQTGTPSVIYGNVVNGGLIENLPADSVVEVPCLVDKNGVQPVPVGRLPVHLAALMQTNINVQACAVEGIVTGRREYLRHAAALDPHTAAELDLDRIGDLVDALLEEHGDWIPLSPLG